MSNFASLTVALLAQDAIAQDTADLVDRFACEMLRKLAKAEADYGYGIGWMRDDWRPECRQALLDHVRKGDPRDVANYCAFMWHHGWPTNVWTDAEYEDEAVTK